MSIDKTKTPYYFRECGLTIWLNASQYTSLKLDSLSLLITAAL